MLITSVDNKKVKLITSLKDSKKRHELGMFMVEGMHLVKEAYTNNSLIDVIVQDGCTLDFPCSIEPIYVTDNVMRKISFLKNSSNVIGICHIDEHKYIDGNRLLILDGVQDPGNLGTIIRSSCAFNVDTIILSTDTVDLYNEKVVRSTQGMLFHINIVVRNLCDVIPQLKNSGYTIFGTDVLNGEEVHDIKCQKYALIMGNEGNGVSSNVKKLCDRNLYIKMNSKCESLNVGVATGILLYELGGKYE